MKNIFLKIFVAGFLFLFSDAKIFAQNDIADSLSEKVGDLTPNKGFVDTSLSKNKYDIEDDSMQDYKKDKGFAYMKYLDSLLRKTKNLTADTLTIDNANSYRRKNNNSEVSPHRNLKFNFLNNSAVKIFLWLLAIGFIIFILYKLFAGGNFFRRNRNNKYVSDAPPEEENATDVLAYERLIAQAEANKNFRLAVRYYYLRTLQQLSNAGAVELSADKTNYQYVNELKGKLYQNDFASVTLNYEYVWYGKFDINEETYNKLANNFKAFSKKFNVL